MPPLGDLQELLGAQKRAGALLDSDLGMSRHKGVEGQTAASVRILTALPMAKQLFCSSVDVLNSHLPEFEFLDLTAGGCGKFVDKIDEPGNFIIGDIFFAEASDTLLAHITAVF